LFQGYGWSNDRVNKKGDQDEATRQDESLEGDPQAKKCQEKLEKIERGKKILYMMGSSRFSGRYLGVTSVLLSPGGAKRRNGGPASICKGGFHNDL
jgi:hypothetical protein